MARPREGSFSVVPLNLDRNEVDKFNQNFGKGRLSEIVREYIHDENERIESEKKVMPPSKGALINYTTNPAKKIKGKEQTTLDLFAKIDEINGFINDTKDVRQLQQMKRNAHVIETVARTKLIKISKGLINLT